MEGERQGELRMVRLLLETCFGRLSPELLKCLEVLPEERLLRLVQAFWQAGSLQDLRLDEIP
jgi:hypothetical protein